MMFSDNDKQECNRLAIQLVALSHRKDIGGYSSLVGTMSPFEMGYVLAQMTTLFLHVLNLAGADPEDWVREATALNENGWGEDESK